MFFPCDVSPRAGLRRGGEESAGRVEGRRHQRDSQRREPVEEGVAALARINEEEDLPAGQTESEQAAKQIKQSVADADFPESKTTSNQSSDRQA